ncbi:MAG: DUF3313 domain-containing protein [Planctomycetota bacterium]|jgi:hypothetical protein
MMLIQCGCSAKLGRKKGFLHEYSKLERQFDVSYRYIGPYLGCYSQFIVDPAEVHFHTGSKAHKLSEDNMTDMQNYMHTATVNAISDRYSIAYQPGPGVARLRVALTDLKKSKVLQKIYPTSKLLGTGLEGASMEAELVDSQNGMQIGAAIESQLGDRLSLEGSSAWGDGKAVMDDWAKRFGERLDEAHGR